MAGLGAVLAPLAVVLSSNHPGNALIVAALYFLALFSVAVLLAAAADALVVLHEIRSRLGTRSAVGAATEARLSSGPLPGSSDGVGHR